MSDRVRMETRERARVADAFNDLVHVQDEIASPALRCDSDRKMGSAEFIVGGRLRSYAMSRVAVSFEIGNQRS